MIALAGMVAVVGCSGRDPVAKEADNTAGLPAINDTAPDPSGAAPAEAQTQANGSTADTGAADAIPAALHGRWGLTPGDCTSTRGDAKGLLIVSASSMKFYESRAVPASDAQANRDSITGNFAFTGEGQTWTRFQSLELKGQELVRTESNPVASYTYARCE